jgi:excisionase family DNA binding protein
MTPETKATQSATDVVWMAPAEAARTIGCSRATLWRLIRNGGLPSIRIAPRIQRVAVPAELVESARLLAGENRGGAP